MTTPADQINAAISAAQMPPLSDYWTSYEQGLIRTYSQAYAAQRCQELEAKSATLEIVATVVEELENDGQGWCSKVRWLYNPVPVGELLSWERPK